MENKFEPKQIEGYREMVGDEKIEIVFRLNALVREIARDGIIVQHPKFSSMEIEKELQRRIEYGRTRTV